MGANDGPITCRYCGTTVGEAGKPLPGRIVRKQACETPVCERARGLAPQTFCSNELGDPRMKNHAR